MEELYKTHDRIVLMYIAVPGGLILLCVICALLFRVLPPFQLIAVGFATFPLICTKMRLRLWKDRDTLFSADELKTRTVQSFFVAAIFEVAFSLGGLVVILGDK